MKRLTLEEYTYTPNTKTIFSRSSPLGKTFVDSIDISVETYDDELINLALSLKSDEKVLINDTYIANCIGIVGNGEDMPYDIHFKVNKEH